MMTGKYIFRGPCRKIPNFSMSTMRCWSGWGKKPAVKNLYVMTAACGKSANPGYNLTGKKITLFSHLAYMLEC
jgi:hypothetical protein